MITNDAVTFGLLAAVLGAVFYTSSRNHGFWSRFYRIVPAILVCYFVPSVFTATGLVNGENSNLYFVASHYLLPASLVLLTMSVDLKGIANLGPKAIILFGTGTIGVIIGGPLALMITSVFFPEYLGDNGPNAVWRGMATVAGSWIGGGANQAAMKEIFDVGPDIFSAMVAVDVLVANVLWMPVLLYMANNAKQIDARLGADTSAITQLRERVEQLQLRHARNASLPDFMLILAVAFGAVGLSHLCADFLAPWFQTHHPQWAHFSVTSHFFWLIVIATAIGVGLSFTRAQSLEGAGASRVGSVFIFILVATIGLKMNILAVKDHPGLFLLGAIWIMIHASLMFLVAWLIKAPVFYLAVGSQANIGGAASAPVVAAAFHPSLAPVGVLLAVLGYVLGTYGGWFCGQVLRVIAT